MIGLDQYMIHNINMIGSFIKFTTSCLLGSLPGFGAYMSATGGSILSLEYVPLRYRAVASGVLQMLWAVGYLLSVLTAFYITE